MKKLLCMLAGASVMAIATPALAQEESTFTGPRVEAILGYDITKAGSSVDDDLNADNDESMEGLLYGGAIGYDMNLGGLVVGVEGELTDSTAKTKFENGDFEGFGFGNVKAGRDLYVGARLGAVVAPNALLYVKGGYTNARFNIRSSDGTVTYREKFDSDGWRAGAGAEVALDNNIYTKLEYRYSNYSKAEIDFGGDLPDSDRFDVDVDRHQIVAGVGVRF